MSDRAAIGSGVQTVDSDDIRQDRFNDAREKDRID